MEREVGKKEQRGGESVEKMDCRAAASGVSSGSTLSTRKEE
jgi:hypothetical protein